MKELIDILKREKIYLSVEEGSLKLSYDDDIRADLLDQIKSNKAELIQYLTSMNNKQKSILKTTDEDILISPTQTKFWLIDKMLGPGNLYNIPAIYKIKGQIKSLEFQEAWSGMLQRHEILRTVFVEKDDLNIYQKVTNSESSTQFIDVKASDESEVNLKIKEIIDFQFDLKEGPLCLSYLLETASDEYIWVTNFHHIIFDGWSSGIFLKEFKTIYKNIVTGKKATEGMLKPEFQYKDYAQWHRTFIEQDKYTKAYWHKLFSDLPERLQLPSMDKNKDTFNHRGASIQIEFDANWLAELKSICAKEQTTLFSGLFVLVNAVLNKLSGQSDIVMGTPSSGREHPQLQDLIGFFVNTVPIRNKVFAGLDFSQHLKITGENIADAFEHQWLPFDTLVEQLNLPFDPLSNPLFDVFLALQNIETESGDVDDTEPFHLKPYDIHREEVAKFDLTFAFSESNQQLELYLNYNVNVFNDHHIQVIEDTIKTVFNGWVFQPSLSLSQLFPVSDIQTKTLIELGRNDVALPKSFSNNVVEQLDNLFSEQFSLTALNYQDSRQVFCCKLPQAFYNQKKVRKELIGFFQYLHIVLHHSHLF